MIALQNQRVQPPFPGIPICFFIYFLKCMQIQMILCDWCFVARLSGGSISVPFFLLRFSIYLSFWQARNNESKLLVPYSIWQSKIRYNKIIQIFANLSYQCIVRGFFFLILYAVGCALPVVDNLFKLGGNKASNICLKICFQEIL